MTIEKQRLDQFTIGEFFDSESDRTDIDEAAEI